MDWREVLIGESFSTLDALFDDLLVWSVYRYLPLLFLNRDCLAEHVPVLVPFDNFLFHFAELVVLDPHFSLEVVELFAGCVNPWLKRIKLSVNLVQLLRYGLAFIFQSEGFLFLFFEQRHQCDSRFRFLLHFYLSILRKFGDLQLIFLFGGIGLTR